MFLNCLSSLLLDILAELHDDEMNGGSGKGEEKLHSTGSGIKVDRRC